MKNTIRTITLVTIAAGFVFATACQPASTGNTSVANATNAKPSNQVTNTSLTPAANSAPASAPGSLATPTEAYKTAYELRKNKDIAGLKKIMAPDIIEFLTMVGEEEKKSLDDMLKEMCEKPQADRAEARNEKISGDRATVEYLTETGDWKTMDFEKIDGQWKLGLPKSDEAEKQQQ